MQHSFKSHKIFWDFMRSTEIIPHISFHLHGQDFHKQQFTPKSAQIKTKRILRQNSVNNAFWGRTVIFSCPSSSIPTLLTDWVTEGRVTVTQPVKILAQDLCKEVNFWCSLCTRAAGACDKYEARLRSCKIYSSDLTRHLS